MNNLPITEELDFAYLLELMPPLHDTEGFSWLPELFSIVGHETLIKLCRYAGGETIRIPTLEELESSVQAIQWFYDTMIHRKKSIDEIPSDILPMVKKISEVYCARDGEE